MTGEQKREIDGLRRSGLGYRKIAARLGLSENTVKAYIRRGGTIPKPAAEEKQANCCPQCGADLSRLAGRKSRRYCSDACRLAWWKAHEHSIDRRAWYSRVCVGCGKTFKSYGNKNRKYCGHACYIQDRFNKGARL